MVVRLFVRASVDMRENIRQDRAMDKSTIIAKLRQYEAELKAAGIEHLLLHGSYARGTPIREASDVDIIADLDQAKKFSLLGRVHLEKRLTDILGVKADLADRKMLRPEVLERARDESILVF
jgi:predicted nucleotidyltransferase